MRDTSATRVVTVFRSRLRPDADDRGYLELAARMEARARTMPGFVEFSTFESADGERLSLIVFESMEHQRAWRDQPEHRDAQERGRREFYEHYAITVGQEVRHHAFGADGDRSGSRGTGAGAGAGA